MGPKVIEVGIILLFFSLSVRTQYLMVKKRDWIGNSPPNIREGDLECFSEYMELWIHRMRIEGLKLWLSGTLRIPVSLASLDNLNLQLSVCGFSLHRDTERNYIFRVMYSGCFVQQEHGDFVIVLNLQKRVGRFGGRTNTFVMKCPVVTAPPSAEHIHCNPNFIQVTRKIPLDSWNNKLHWSLALRGKLVVALEDASLIQLNTEINGSSITVQGKRRDIMSREMVMEKYEEFLPLKLVSGHYAYSMEASCPSVSRSPAGETVLHIFKRRMGLTKRGGYDRETLSVSDVSVTQTNSFSVSESRDFVELAIPTSRILQTKNCTGPAGEALLQAFFRVDVVLTFKEMPHKVNWSMENFSPCTASLSPAVTQAQEDHSPVPRSPPQPSASTSDFHTTTTVQPPTLLRPTNQRLFAETVARKTTSGSGLLSSGEAFGSTGVTTLAADVSPGVASQNVLGNTSHVTSVSPGSASAAPSTVAQGTSASADPDLRPLPQLESETPVSELHLASPWTVEGAPPTPTDPRASGTATPKKDVTGRAGSASAPPQPPTGLHRGLSVGPTEGSSQGDEGAFTETAPDTARMKNTATEERDPKPLNASEPTRDSLSETRGHAWERRLMKTSAPPLTSSPPNERAQEVSTPPASPSPSPLHPTPCASEATEDDREQTRSVATPPVTASGLTMSSDVQAGEFANTSQAVASVNGTDPPRRTLVVAAGQTADSGDDPVTPLNSSDSLWTRSFSRQDATESPTAWVNRTDSP